MKISEEDFAQLGLTDKDIASAITESVYQAYKESPSLRRLKKAIRESILPKLEEKAEQMNFRESLTGKDVRGHVKPLKTTKERLVKLVPVELQQFMKSK